jgi:PilZ domain-containing protein
MATPEPVHARLQIALGILGDLPSRVAVVAADGSRFPAEVTSADGDCLSCSPLEEADTNALGGAVTLVVGDGHRAGYEIECVPVPRPAHSALRLAVIDTRRVKPRRRHDRIDVSESALMRPAEAETEVDVHVVDISSDGLAFVSSRPFQVGDSVSGMLNIDQRAFPINARVAHTQSVGFGRFRIGCQFTRIAEFNRHVLEQIARRVPSERRRLRPIEVVENASGRKAEIPPASLSLDRQPVATVPTPRYCRPCGRVTLQHEVSRPGQQSHWRCCSCR